MATNVHKKPSKKLRPQVVELQKASMKKMVQVIAQAKQNGVTPKALGRIHYVKLG